MADAQGAEPRSANVSIDTGRIRPCDVFLGLSAMHSSSRRPMESRAPAPLAVVWLCDSAIRASARGMMGIAAAASALQGRETT